MTVQEGLELKGNLQRKACKSNFIEITSLRNTFPVLTPILTNR